MTDTITDRIISKEDAMSRLKNAYPLLGDVGIANIIKESADSKHPYMIDFLIADTKASFASDSIERNLLKPAEPVDFRDREWNPDLYYALGGDMEEVIDTTRDGKAVVMNPTMLARLFLKHVPALKVNDVNPEIYTYNNATGLWCTGKEPIEIWMQHVYDYLFDKREPVKDGSDSVKQKYDFAAGYSPNKNISDAVEEVIRSAPVLDLSKNRFDASIYSCISNCKLRTGSPVRGVPLSNGVLCFDEEYNPYIEEYGPWWLFTRKADHGYFKNADTKVAKDILSQWMPNSDDEVNEDGTVNPDVCEGYMKLVQYPAQAIIHQYTQASWKKSYYGFGVGNCAKTTYGDSVSFLFGKHLSSKTKINNLSKDFGKAPIAGKWVNNADETHATGGVNIDEFKDVYGSNEIEVNAKYKQPEVKQMLAVGYHAGNTMMKASAAMRNDGAFLRRWIILHFEQQFPTDPMWESEHFTEEFGNAYMKLAVEAASKIMSSKQLLYNMTEDDILAEFSVNDELTRNIIDYFFDKAPKGMPDNDLPKNGYGIPVIPMMDFFKILTAQWDFYEKAIGDGTYNSGVIDGVRVKDILPSTPRTLTTTMSGIGIKKIKCRGKYGGEELNGHWYIGLRFNTKGDALMGNKL